MFEELLSDQGREMARVARAAARNSDVLYHGTRYTEEILRDMELRHAHIGDECVCLTRSPEVAAYWATLPRDDLGRGGILVLDRASLGRRYKLEPFHDPCWDDFFENDEMEERIYDRDVIKLDRHLIHVVLEPPGTIGPAILKELRRRAEAKKLKDSLNAEASVLHRWAIAKFPDHDGLVGHVSVIIKLIQFEYWRLKAPNRISFV